MKISSQILAVIFGALCAPFIFSCVQKTPAEKAAEEKILLAGNAADPASLDPSLSTGFNEYKILSSIFEGLVCADTRTLEILPAAAKRWDISHNGRTYVFHIDENAKWSDGSNVTAQDFVFAWRRTLNPKLGAEYASMLFPIKNARKINAGKADPSSLGARAVSDSELQVELEEPTPYFLSLLYHPSYFPLPKKTLEKFGAVESRDALWTRPNNIISNGPFILSKWSINDRVCVRENPFYRDAANVKLNGVDFIPITNVNTEDRAFRAGQLHVTDSVAPSRIEGMVKNSPEVLHRNDWLGVYYYIVNTKVAPFDNPKVRRALTMSIDRRAIIDSFLKAGQKPALTFVPSGCDGYAPESRAAIEENVARARALAESDGDTRVADLHLWRIGAHETALILSVVSGRGLFAEDYRKRFKDFPELAHINVEVIPCRDPDCPCR